MNKNFEKTLEKIKSASPKEIPSVKFDKKLYSVKSKYSKALKHFEGMLTMLEGYPFLPFKEEIYTGCDEIYSRLFLTYEIIFRLIGHCRSVVANANINNHIGISVAIRCILEIYAFSAYLNSNKDNFDENDWELLLNGSTKTAGELNEIKMVYKKYENKDLPEDFEDFFKSFMKTPQVGKYLKKIKKNEEGFDILYSAYSQYVHPTFGPATERALEISKLNNKIDFYGKLYKDDAPELLILHDIDASDFCMQMTWSHVLELDPMFDKSAYNQLPTHLAQMTKMVRK